MDNSIVPEVPRIVSESSVIKCACPTCQCLVTTGKDPSNHSDRCSDKTVLRDGAIYCSAVCAYECTETTCLCVHDHCEPRPPM